MSMRLRYLASLKAKALKEDQSKKTDVTQAVHHVEIKPVVPVVETVTEETSVVNDSLPETDQPLEVVSSNLEVHEEHVPEVVEDETQTPKKKTGRRFGKDPV